MPSDKQKWVLDAVRRACLGDIISTTWGKMWVRKTAFGQGIVMSHAAAKEVGRLAEDRTD